MKEFLNKKNVFAILGVSENPEKYGTKVYNDLRNSGYKVYPVNPNNPKAYKKLSELPVKPDVAVMVIPPEITELIVKECNDLGIKKVWMQPGSESEKAIKYCNENNIKVLHGLCIIINRKKVKNIYS